MRISLRALARGSRAKQWLESSYGFTRTFPKAYMDRVKGLEPHITYDNRFGAPPVHHWFHNAKSSTHRPDEDDYVHTEHLPFEREAIEANKNADRARQQSPFKLARKPAWSKHSWPCKDYDEVEMIPDEQWHFFVGDLVEIQVGKDKGKRGRIWEVRRERNLVKVHNLHTRRIFVKGQGVVIDDDEWKDVEQFLHADQVKLVYPKTGEVGECYWSINRETGEQMRFMDTATSSSIVMNIPNSTKSSYDFNSLEHYVEVAGKDTLTDDVVKMTQVYNVTNEPPMSFEQSLAKEYGLPEEKRGKTYWY